jgi:histidine kinase-like protein
LGDKGLFRSHEWLERIWVRVFVVLPLANVLLVWINDWTGWLWSRFVRSDVGGNTVIFEHGPGYIFRNFNSS